MQLSKFILPAFFLAGLTSGISAQEINQTSITVNKSAVVIPTQITEDWAPVIQSLEMPKPGSNSDRARLLELKEERKKSRTRNASYRSGSNRSGQAPAVQMNFEGNPYNFRVPNDNDIAISNAGKIISVVNSTIYTFDETSTTPTGNWSLSAFAASLGVNESMFDPKVEYDPVNDRFVMVWLAGFLDSTSQIILAFSQTGDPLLGWNLYALPGNPLNNSTWSDYPVIGLSKYELFIGMNTFTNGSTNNSGFTESCLWQVGLREGYNGNTLQTNYFNNILQQGKPLFNICPVRGGSIPTGPDMFLLSNRNLEVTSDTLFLLHIGDTLNGPNHGLSVNTLFMPRPYVLPPTARQPNNHTFDTNDSRVLGAFFENDKIQFVQCTEDTATGYAAVYHGIIDNPYSSPTLTATVYGDTLLDLGFPNIVYTGDDSLDNSAMITVNHSGATVNPGCSAFNYDGNGQYSDLVTIKEGFRHVHVLSGFYERWGDYSGSQRRYNEPGMVWMSGYYGTNTYKNGTWIAELTKAGPTPSVKESGKEDAQASIYPNPAKQYFTIDFTAPERGRYTFTLYDMHGRKVKVLMEEELKSGLNRFSFSSEPLSPGVYLLNVSGPGVSLTERLVKGE